MKVKCTHCGKRFDYEMHTGLCPHCCTYSQAENQTTSPVITQNLEPNHITSTCNPTTPSKEKQKTGKQSHSRVYYIVTAVLVALIIGCILLTIVITYLSNQKSYQENTLQELLEPIPLTTDDVISYNTESGIFHVQITGATIDDDPYYELPEGYDVLQVSYIITSEEATRSYDGTLSIPYELEHGLVPYLVTESGSYLQPIFYLDIEKLKQLSYNDVDSLGISEKFAHEDGRIYFLVRENDAKGLYVNHFAEDNSSSDEKLEKAYMITFSEVK